MVCFHSFAVLAIPVTAGAQRVDWHVAGLDVPISSSAPSQCMHISAIERSTWPFGVSSSRWNVELHGFCPISWFVRSIFQRSIFSRFHVLGFRRAAIAPAYEQARHSRRFCSCCERLRTRAPAPAPARAAARRVRHSGASQTIEIVVPMTHRVQHQPQARRRQHTNVGTALTHSPSATATLSFALSARARRASVSMEACRRAWCS